MDWVQAALLTSCSARLGTYIGEEFRNPIASLSLKMNVSCPIVPWTEMEASALRSDIFLILLHRLGLLPPAPQTGLYPRIPREWSSDTLYSVALSFGPVEQQNVDFDLALVSKVELPIPSSLADMPEDGKFLLPFYCLIHLIKMVVFYRFTTVDVATVPGTRSIYIPIGRPPSLAALG